MKNQIKIIIQTKKIESYFVGIMSLILLCLGFYMNEMMKTILSDPEIHVGILQGFFMTHGTLLGGILGIIIATWQYKTARKIESSK